VSVWLPPSVGRYWTWHVDETPLVVSEQDAAPTNAPEPSGLNDQLTLPVGAD
jgi:hypothetical protein